MARVEGAFEQVTERLNSMDRRLDRIETTMESRFGLVDQRLNWVIGIVVSTWITTVLTVLFHR